MEILVVALMLAGVVAVSLYPGLRRSRRAAPASEAALRAEVDRRRAAIRAGTLCGFCGQPNPERSRYCMECGRQLSS